MLKNFFESPEIAAIFATKDKDKDTVYINEDSRLRVGKHTRKRDHNIKTTLRSKSRGNGQNNREMFSARRLKMENEGRVINVHGENDYYDYDDETGMIVKKKHSVFYGCTNIFGDKQISKEQDKLKSNVDISKDDSMQQVVHDSSKNGDGYCPSDSAYETNYDDFTDSLERLVIHDDVAAGENTPDESRKRTAVNPAGERESPYRRCRSSAICGRNCEICGGRNNNIVQGKHKHSKKSNKEHSGLMKGREKAENRQLKGVNMSDSNGIRTHGMFSSKNRKESALVEDSRYSKVSKGQEGQPDGKALQLSTRAADSPLLGHFDGAWGSISSSPLSTTSWENLDTSIHESEYYETRTPLYAGKIAVADERNANYAHGFSEFENNMKYIDGYPSPNLGHAEQTYGYEAFSRGPHLLMLYDFKAEHEDDVSVPKGEIVLLLDNRDRDWVWVLTSDNEEGYVPRSLTVPYNDCEECRQEEMRQRMMIAENDIKGNESSLDASAPRTTRTNSRSSTASSKSNKSKSEKNSFSKRVQQSPITNSYNENQTGNVQHQSKAAFDRIDVESDQTISVSYTTSHKLGQIDGSPVKGSAQPHPDSPTRYGTSVRLDETIQSARNITLSEVNAVDEKTEARQKSRTNSKHDHTSPRRDETSPKVVDNSREIRKLSSTSTSSRLSSNEPGSGLRSQENTSSTVISEIDKQEELIMKRSLKLITLSSYEATKPGKLSVTAGDVVYVDLKEQKIQDWLWVYSPGTKSFGFIPESVLHQLKSSVV